MFGTVLWSWNSDQKFWSRSLTYWKELVLWFGDFWQAVVADRQLADHPDLGEDVLQCWHLMDQCFGWCTVRCSNPTFCPNAKPIKACILAPATTLSNLKTAAAHYDTYSAILAELKSETPPSNQPTGHPARALMCIWGDLSISDEDLILVASDWIFVLQGMCQLISNILHEGRCSLQKTWTTANHMYFWPNIPNQIKQTIDQCEPCQHFWPSLPAGAIIIKAAIFAFCKNFFAF